MEQRKQRALNPTKAMRVAAEERRYKMLELTKAGATERQIAEALGVSPSLVHKDVKRILHALAVEHLEMADEIRALQNVRYTTLLSRWWPIALNGDEAATKMVLSIMHRISEINGIHEKPLVTLNQQINNMIEREGPITFDIQRASGNYSTNGHGPPPSLPEADAIS